MMRAVRRMLATFGRPVVRYFDRWFSSVRDDLEASTRHAAHEATRGADAASSLWHEFHQLRDELRTDAETMLELTTTVARAVDQAAAAASEASAAATRAVRAGATATSAGQPLAALDQPGADLVNWAISSIGMAGEAGVWLNQGANVSFAAARAWIENLNERIIELPWAHAAAARLPVASAVLDIGSAESLFAIELATMGHRAIALDPRPYGLEHANLQVVTATVEGWEGPTEPFDAVFAISAIEHFGLGHYVPAAEQGDLDRVAMDRFASWLRPDGLLFLTVPFGRWSVDELQRVYDTEHLSQLIDGWKVIDRSAYARVSSVEWTRLEPERIDAPWSHSDAGVVLLELSRPAP